MEEQLPPPEDNVLNLNNRDDFHDLLAAAEVPLPAIMGQDDPRRMVLTRQERDWALDIKDGVEMMPDLDNLTDFWYAQYAIICRGDTEDAVRRAYALQYFREEYRISGEMNDAIRHVHNITRLCPRQIMNFSFSTPDGTYVIVHDITGVNAPSNVDEYCAGAYHYYNMMNPDLESVRKGHITVREAEGFDWTKRQDFKLVQKYFKELLTVYPLLATTKLYNTGTIFNSLWAMCRIVLPKYIKDAIHVGFTAEDRLDTYFFVPSVDEANERLRSRMDTNLQRRYTNEKVFSLSAG